MHQWQIDDYFYERSIHETTLSNEQAYLTEIQVRILSEEKGSFKQRWKSK